MLSVPLELSVAGSGVVPVAALLVIERRIRLLQVVSVLA